MSDSDMSGSDMSGSDSNEVVEHGAAAPAAPPGFVAAEVRRLDAAEAAAAASDAGASLPRGKRKRKVANPAAGSSNMVAQLLGGFKRSAGWDGGAGPVARAVAAGASTGAGDAMSPGTPANPAAATGPSKFIFGFAGTKTSTTPAASSLRELLQRTKATAAQQAAWQPTQGAGSVQVSPFSVAKTACDKTEHIAGSSIRMPLTRTSSRSPPTQPSFTFSPPRPTSVDGAGSSPTTLAIAFSTAADAAAAAPRFSFANAVPPPWRDISSTAASNDAATKVTTTRDDVSDNYACAPVDSNNRLQPASRLRVLQRAKVRQGKSMKCVYLHLVVACSIL